MQDMVLDTQQEVLQAAVKEQPNLAEAIILLKVWARAQGFDEQPDSINGFLLSMLVAHLAATGSLVSLRGISPAAYLHRCAYHPFTAVLSGFHCLGRANLSTGCAPAQCTLAWSA